MVLKNKDIDISCISGFHDCFLIFYLSAQILQSQYFEEKLGENNINVGKKAQIWYTSDVNQWNSMSDQKVLWLFANFSCSMTFPWIFHDHFYFPGFPGFPVFVGNLIHTYIYISCWKRSLRACQLMLKKKKDKKKNTYIYISGKKKVTCLHFCAGSNQRPEWHHVWNRPQIIIHVTPWKVKRHFSRALNAGHNTGRDLCAGSPGLPWARLASFMYNTKGRR